MYLSLVLPQYWLSCAVELRDSRTVSLLTEQLSSCAKLPLFANASPANMTHKSWVHRRMHSLAVVLARIPSVFPMHSSKVLCSTAVAMYIHHLRKTLVQKSAVVQGIVSAIVRGFKVTAKPGSLHTLY